MADQPLVSPEEVASVLSSGDSPEAPAADSEAAGSGSNVYSLRRPVAIAPEAEPEARQRVESFALGLVEILGAELETEIAAELTGFQQQQVAAAVESMPAPTWILDFECPSGGGIALVLEPASALTFVELALGGVGSLPSTGREPTPLETRVMSNLGQAVLDVFARKTGATLARSTFAVGRVPGKLAAPGETVGAGLLNLKFSGIDGRGLLLATAGLLTPGGERAGAVPVQKVGPMAARLAKVAVEARPVLGGGLVSLHDLMELKEDSVLQLEVLEDTLLELRVAEQAMFTGRVSRKDEQGEFAVFWRRGRRVGEPRAPEKKKETA